MTGIIECRLKRYLQPFERELAVRELAALSASEPEQLEPHVYQVKSKVPISTLTSHATYWESFHNGVSLLSTQVRYEMSAEKARQISLKTLDKSSDPNEGIGLPSRRVLRYGPHDAHEYRGKFFPQLVRAAINISGVEPDALIGDPMVGSGTTAVEALLAGRSAVGLDLNPLSVLVSQSKVDALSMKPKEIERSYGELDAAIRRRRPGLAYFRSLHPDDQNYLKRWFSDNALRQVDRIMRAALGVSDARARRIFTVALSNSLRAISFQKNDDLRVRRDVESAEQDPMGLCRSEIERQTRLIASLALELDTTIPTTRADVRIGDVRELTKYWSDWSRGLDLIVTSPPYATALPYLDTDRLSLIYLGLSERATHRQRDLEMIGNREVTKGHRSSYLKLLDEKGHLLPSAVVRLIRKIERLNRGTEAGFRRQNLPALLSKYFFDMRTAFGQMSSVSKPGAQVFMVVGNNHTVANGRRIEIPTPQLLAQVAESVDYEVDDMIAMDMLTSRDIFRSNSGSAESILVLRTPGT